VFSLLLALMTLACAPKGTDSAVIDEDTAAGTTRPDNQGPGGSDSAGPQGDDSATSGPVDTGSGGDDAQLVTDDFPASLACGESITAAVVMKNTGETTWTRDALYKLGAVDDADPFYTADTRVWLTDTESIEPGESTTFAIPLLAPDEPGAYTSDWRMVHEGVRWFGESTAAVIDVSCEPAPDRPPLDLGAVTWLHTDVSGWAETSTLSPLYVSGDNLCMDYDKADTWPVMNVYDEDVVGNPWIFIYQDERWYGGTWEWLRPGQTCKALTSVAGDHIKQSPFDADSGWRPTSGETYYFMISGLARDSTRNAEERTAPVPFVWP